MIEQGRLEEALEFFQKSLEIARETEDLRFLGAPLNNLGLVATLQWNFIEARDYYQQALEIAQKTGERSGEAVALGNLGFIFGSLGDYPEARSITERYLRICREAGNPYYEANALVNLCAWAIAMNDPTAARQNALQSRQISQRIGDRSGEAWALTYLGHSYFALGEMETARQAYEAALSIRQDLAQPELASEPAAGLAQVALLHGDLPAARQYVSDILTHLEAGGSLQGADNPLRVYLTCFRVLQQTGDPRAQNLLETAYQILHARAAKIPDEQTRRAFLDNIEQHREIQAAHSELG
jgi:tetratricopeptide (TPR) repeat protein